MYHNNKYHDHNNHVMIMTSCFIPGTLITLPNGTTLAIERLRPGDIVLSFAGDGTPAESVVSTAYQGISRELLEITTLPMLGADSVTVRCDGRHRFWRGASRYTEARALARGDLIVLWDGLEFRPAAIGSIAAVPGEYDVWNLHMASGPPAFVAGSLAVHNAKV